MGNQQITQHKFDEADYPWVWAIRDVQQLSFKNGLTRAQVATASKEQSQMPVEILPYLYLSNARCAHDIEVLKARRITHVLNTAGVNGRAVSGLYKRAGILVCEFDGRDVEGFPILRRYLHRARRFIQLAKQAQGKVVVHCVAGLNRSGIIVAAEYMLATRSNVLDTVAHCRRQRGDMCLCNRSFQAQLVALARAEGLLGPAPGDLDCRVTNKPPPFGDREGTTTTTQTIPAAWTLVPPRTLHQAEEEEGEEVGSSRLQLSS